MPRMSNNSCITHSPITRGVQVRVRSQGEKGGRLHAVCHDREGAPGEEAEHLLIGAVGGGDNGDGSDEMLFCF